MLLDVIAILVPLEQERSQRAVAGADGGHELDVELTLGVPDVLAIGEVGIATATASQKDVLNARGQRAVAGADGGHELDVELTLGVPDVLAIGEVGIATATASQKDVLNARVVSHLHGNADLVIGVHRNAEDLAHLVVVRLDEQLEK